MAFNRTEFSKVVSDVTGGNPKIPKRDFEKFGIFPIYDQGKSDVSGFTDDESKLFRGNVPVVLFGDHTREVRYVDHPFALGADGVKILSTTNELAPKFLFYYLIHHQVPSHGYSRHFKYLKEYEIPLPATLSEQLHIVEILDQADALRQQRRQANQISQKILPALFQEMFGDPATMGERYEIQQFGEVLRSTKNGLYKHKDFYGSGVPILKMFNIYEGWLKLDRLDSVELDKKEHESYRLNSGDILFNRVNTPELVGKCAVINEQVEGGVFESKNIRAQVNPNRVSPYFAAAFFNSEYGHRILTRRLKHAAGMATITGPDIREASLPLPRIEVQREFEDACLQVRSLTFQTSTSTTTLETLFQTLLHRAFDGSLTAKWREDHATELLQEMESQSR